MQSFRFACVSAAIVTSLAGTLASLPAAAETSINVDANFSIPGPGGCGPGGWRGPWGHCNYPRNWGPHPGGYYTMPTYNGCPPGSWRGPWGHCRNTPFHGPLPNGGWR